jgi:hypothetical protein
MRCSATKLGRRPSYFSELDGFARADDASRGVPAGPVCGAARHGAVVDARIGAVALPPGAIYLSA